MNGHSQHASMPQSTQYSPYQLYLPSVDALLSLKASSTWLYTTLVVITTFLILEQTVYRSKKRHLPGSKWTIPIIGKFADSLHPTLENYEKQWDSGALSALSVFNM